MNNEKGSYNIVLNSSENFFSKFEKLNKSQMNPLDKNFDFGGLRNEFIFNNWLWVKEYLMEKINIEGLENLVFDKYIFLDKIFNGVCGIYKIGDKVVPVNISITQFNFLNNPKEIKIVEPLNRYLDGKTFKIEDKNLDGFKEIVEIKLNYDRWPLILIIREFLDMIGEIWDLAYAENNNLLTKYLVNGNVLNAKQMEEIINNSVRDKRINISIVDFTSDLADINRDNQGVIKLDWDDITQRIINKYEFVFRNLFKRLGIPFNNQADKKGANVIEKEITTETGTAKYTFNHMINIINIGLQEVNKKFSLNLKASENTEYEDKIEEEQNEILKSEKSPKNDD